MGMRSNRQFLGTTNLRSLGDLSITVGTIGTIRVDEKWYKINTKAHVFLNYFIIERTY